MEIDKSSFFPYQKVSFIDAQEWSVQHKALFNPNELAISTSAQIGKLAPIGWSQPVKQYARTNEASFSLSLQYSKVAYDELELQYMDHQYAYRFFLSFLYGERPGFAPHFLLVLWPKSVSMTVTVESVNVRFTRWDTALNVRDYAIDLQLTEVAETFLSSDQVFSHGFRRLNRRVVSPQAIAAAARIGTIGRPLNTINPYGKK